MEPLKTFIDNELYNKLNFLGLIPNDVRKDNVGKSNYSKHLIQPWSIWLDYPELTSWDHDMIKRILRTKEEEGMSETEARIMDYEKIKHICDERIRQLKFTPKPLYEQLTAPEILHGYIAVPEWSQPSLKFNTSELSYSLNKKQVEKYNQFSEDHKHCGGHIEICFSHKSGIGVSTKFYCTGCGDEMEVTDISKW